MYRKGQLVQLPDGFIHKVDSIGQRGCVFYMKCKPDTERRFAIVIVRSVALHLLCPKCFATEEPTENDSGTRER